MLAEGGLSSFMGPSATQGLGEPSCLHAGISQRFSSEVRLLIFQGSVHSFHFIGRIPIICIISRLIIKKESDPVQQSHRTLSSFLDLFHYFIEALGAVMGLPQVLQKKLVLLRLEIQLPTLRQRPPEERPQWYGVPARTLIQLFPTSGPQHPPL